MCISRIPYVVNGGLCARGACGGQASLCMIGIGPVHIAAVKVPATIVIPIRLTFV
jgi:hypothetical protein